MRIFNFVFKSSKKGFPRSVFLGLLFYFFFTCLSAQQRKDNSKLVIPFGKGNKITYTLGKGLFDIDFHGRLKISHAAAITKGDTRINSEASAYVRFTSTGIRDRIGQGMEYVIYRKNNEGVVLKQVFRTYTGKEFFITEIKVEDKNAACNYMSPLNAATATLNEAGDLRALSVPFDNDMWVRYNAQRLDTADFMSSEVAAVYNNDNFNGLVIGSLEHETWKSGVHIQATSSLAFDLTALGGFTDSLLTHDLIPHGMVHQGGDECRSPQMMVGYFEDWRDGMDSYGRINHLTEPPFIKSWTGGTPIGWNSWGVLKDKIDLGSAKGVVDFFHDSCKVFRMADHGLFIDLDSYWDRLVKGGVDGDASALREFVAYCNKKGFQPGIYWAPFTDWGKQAERIVEGSHYRYSDAWTMVKGKSIDIDGGRAMDPSHPATKERIKKYISFFKSCGFKMIKIDFLGHATLEADHYFDKNIHTGMQAFKEGMEYLDSVLDNSMLVYAAISPNLATARYVHMRRIACDAFKSIDETAYTLNSTTYGWWQAEMYDFLDADHVVFDNASEGENRARLVSSVVTGSLITGDDFSRPGRWNQTAKALLQNKRLLALVQKDGKPFRPVDGSTGAGPANVFIKPFEDGIYVAVFNYSDHPMDLGVLRSRLGIPENVTVRMLVGAPSTKFAETTDEVHFSLPAKDVAVFQCH